jgi:hypothetical protein
MRTSALLLLLLSATPAFAASFDGIWQGTEKGKAFRYAINGEDVRFYVERDGQFVEDTSCGIAIERKDEGARLAYQECDSDQGPVAVTDAYRLSAKNANTVHVLYEAESGKAEDRGDWMRVP